MQMNKNEGRLIGPNESDFVKNIRNSHCVGCMNERGWCSAVSVLDCWLRKTYLPPHEYEMAMQSDIIQKNVNEISDEIDKKILEEVMKKFKIN